ncbi:hypothetical protein C8R46DRAFT_280919 [Mycena filopes]|nr:hypothetical protein C8R46DRAFT_280919 [Mycena filopes]
MPHFDLGQITDTQRPPLKIPILPAYLPRQALENEVLTSHVLGGSSRSQNSDIDSAEERRRSVLEAALDRPQKEEEEVKHSCGRAGPAETA